MKIGDSDSYEMKGILSAPIFMDNVGCYGLETKLIDCSYHKNNDEDDHINDVWIKCDIATTALTSAVNSSEKSTSTSSVVAMTISLAALGVGILVIAFLVGYLLYMHKSKRRTNGRCV